MRDDARTAPAERLAKKDMPHISGSELPDGSDRLDADDIYARLAHLPDRPRIHIYDVIDSTNAQAKRLIASGAQSPLLIAANGQTAGRGRLGRGFYSPPGAGVYMTLALDAASLPQNPVTITTLAAVAVVRAIESLTGKRPQIKWVNDIYLDGKKICGILAETVTDAISGAIAHALIGIGVNVAAEPFPDELCGVAGSLEAPGLARTRLIAAIAEPFFDQSLRKNAHACMDDYRARSMVIGRRIRYCDHAGEFVYAKALGVDDEGGLIVLHEDGAQAVLRTGEITLRLTRDNRG